MDRYAARILLLPRSSAVSHPSQLIEPSRRALAAADHLGGVAGVCGVARLVRRTKAITVLARVDGL
jgi:hypothetical protein